MHQDRSNLADVTAQFASSIVGRGSYLALQVVLARSLGPQAFGLYAIGWTVAGLVSTAAPVGMPQAALRYSVSGRCALSTAPLAIAAVTGLIGGGLMIATAGPVSHLVFGDPGAAAVIVALAPSVPLTCVFAVLASALRASGANLASAVAGALVFVVYLVATAIAFASGAHRTAVLASHMYTLGLAVTLLPCLWQLLRLPSAARTPELGTLLRFGVVTMFISSANLLNLWADRIVIGIMADPSSVGVYQVASQLAVVAIVLRSAVITVFEARVPKPQTGGLPRDVTREFVAATRLLLHLSAPGLVCLCLTAGYWINLLFGPAYAAAALPLAVLVLGQIAQMFTGPAVNALHMTGEEHAAMRLTGVTCAGNVIGNVVLIPVLGLAGSALASGLANVAVGWVSLRRLWRTGRLQPYLGRIADVILGLLASAGVMAIAVCCHVGSSLAGALGVLVLGYLTYAGIVLLLCRGEDEAVDLARRLLSRLRPQRAQVP